MLTLVVCLYAAGWLLTAAALVVAAVVTPRSISALARDRDRVDSWYREGVAAISADNDQEHSRQHAELERERNARYRRARVPVPSMLGSGNVVETVQFTILRVARANVPSAIVVLTGGLLSTIASVLSLWI